MARGFCRRNIRDWCGGGESGGDFVCLNHMAVTPFASRSFPATLLPSADARLERFGIKFSLGGSHSSRTMMLAELESVLAAVPLRSSATDYRDAILVRNVLAKTTESTRQKSLRHLRELYALDESVPIFALLRQLHAIDRASLPLLAMQVAWARDPLFRATSGPILDLPAAAPMPTASLAEMVDAVFPGQYSELNRNKIARNAASSWTQSGHLAGRSNKIRSPVKPSPAAITMALFLGHLVGHHGAAVFTNPWCRLLDLTADHARACAREAHRAGLLNLRAVGEVVDLSFPRFAELLPEIP